MSKDHLGRWNIEEMEMWPKGYIDLNEPGYVLIQADGTGEFVFGAVVASIDGETNSENEKFEFTWEGKNDRDPASGRGWFEFLSENKATGMLYIHMGDQSSITLGR